MPQRKPWLLAIIVCIVTVFPHVVSSSAGDRSHAYMQCRHGCFEDCHRGIRAPPPSSRRMLLWTCEDDCSYDCMHQVTRATLEKGLQVQQFHGKWPFYRLAGIQEPASTLFSILNGMAHLHGIRAYWRAIPPNYSLKWIWLVYALVNMHSWFWSAVFHTRDLPWTEKMDYFGGTASVLISACCAVLRLFPRLGSLGRTLVTLATGCLFVGHVGYLSLSSFDYGYNMKASVSVFFVNLVLWLVWAATANVQSLGKLPVTASEVAASGDSTPDTSAANAVYVTNLGIFPSRDAAPSHARLLMPPSSHYKLKCVLAVLGLAAAAMLELGDFPPVGFVLDAHALWHMSTIPIIAVWYQFLRDDASYELYSSWAPRVDKKSQ